jgi:hypothetical protein
MKNKIFGIIPLCTFSALISLITLYLAIFTFEVDGYTELEIAALSIISVIIYSISFSIVNTMLTYRYYSLVELEMIAPLNKFSFLIISILGSCIFSILVDFIWFKTMYSSIELFLNSFSQIVQEDGASLSEVEEIKNTPIFLLFLAPNFIGILIGSLVSIFFSNKLFQKNVNRI